MNLRTKILGFSLTIAATAFVLAGLSAGSIYLTARDRDRLNLVRTIDRDIRDAETLATEILIDGGERPYRQWQVLYTSLSKQIDLLQGLPTVSAGGIQEFQTRLQAMDRAFSRISRVGAVEDPLARSILASQVRTNKAALVSRMAALEVRVHDSQETTFRIIVAANSVVLIVLLLLGIVHQVVLRRFAARALDEVTDSIQQIEDGRLSEPIKSERKDEIGWILSALDSMRQQLNRRIEAEDSARQRAEDLSRVKSQFVASVSHELRTPLTGLLGLIDLAHRRDDPAQIKRELDTARKAGVHLLDLVNQILDFSKIEAGKMELSEEAFSPAALLETASSVFAVQAADKGLQLDLVAPKRPTPPLMGDAQRLSQVLFNLVGNAVKFTDIGAVSILYNVEETPEGLCRFRVDVIDTGPGIPPEKQAEIFDEFAQVGARSVAGKVGTGLGLTISNRLIALMGGRIGILPRKGGGAHFFFHVDLPAAPAEDETAPGAVSTGDHQIAPCRILVTDDVNINRMIVAEFLKFDGHSIVEAANGAECLEQLANGGVDVVLMDVNMPVMDGVEATETIRRSAEPWSAIPIVGLTANAFEDQVKGYLAAGMDTCISKPVVQDELRSAIAEAVRSRGQSRPADGSAEHSSAESPAASREAGAA